MKNIYEVLGLEQNPFKSSPDPYFFYHSTEHEEILLRLQMGINERSGLYLVLGDIGVGKTLICRTLLGKLINNQKHKTLLLLNPRYKSEFQFLTDLVKQLNLEPAYRSTVEYRESLRQFLFKTYNEEQKTFILLIDEAQVMSHAQLEVLRNLLNYEVNEGKLIQLILFSQLDILHKLRRCRNFADRIVLKYTLNPFIKNDMINMIKFRLEKAGSKGRCFFTDDSFELIYKKTAGYPRKVTTLCYNALQTMVFLQKDIVNEEVINKTLDKVPITEDKKWQRKEEKITVLTS